MFPFLFVHTRILASSTVLESIQDSGQNVTPRNLPVVTSIKLGYTYVYHNLVWLHGVMQPD